MPCATPTDRIALVLAGGTRPTRPTLLERLGLPVAASLPGAGLDHRVSRTTSAKTAAGLDA